MYYLFIILLYSSIVSAYELPSLELSNNGEPEIVFFNATNVVVDKRLSYVLKWETSNATDVNMTYIGEVAASGNLTVTQAEYNRGEIVLSASNNSSDFVDVVVLNSKNEDLPPPMEFSKPQTNQEQYNNARQYRGVRRPHRRRFY